MGVDDIGAIQFLLSNIMGGGIVATFAAFAYKKVDHKSTRAHERIDKATEHWARFDERLNQRREDAGRLGEVLDRVSDKVETMSVKLEHVATIVDRIDANGRAKEGT